ncbi:MAG: exodeoxyribonuclease VII small subunit [Flavobacterium sp.]
MADKIITLTNKNGYDGKELTCEQAYKQLKQIALEIENETISVEVLAEKFKTASKLISSRQGKLRSSETEVNKIISNIENSNPK